MNIKVEQRHIDERRDSFSDAFSCPIHYAVSEAVGEEVDVEVLIDRITVGYDTYYLPLSMSYWQKQGIAGHEMSPFEFDLDDLPTDDDLPPDDDDEEDDD